MELSYNSMELSIKDLQNQLSNKNFYIKKLQDDLDTQNNKKNQKKNLIINLSIFLVL